MRRSYIHLLGGVLLSLPLLFASCGNGDNALEEIIKNGGAGGSSEGSGEGGGSSTINATAITLSQTMKVIKLGGDALTITATVTPSDATYTWESSDEAIATVENGVVTPVGKGIATITAKSGDVKATCEVFVGTEVTLGFEDYTANDYDILTGYMGYYDLIIPDGFHVAFDELNTNTTIKCDGDATIYLIDGKTNTAITPDFIAGIQIGPSGKTLTINAETDGTGQLIAKGGAESAGIGTGYYSPSCGAITINGGTVNATGGEHGAGIGTGWAYTYDKTCGTITINGGTVTAKGGEGAAGIGTGGANGYCNTCGDITITGNVKSVTATKGAGSPNSIGKGVAYGGAQFCGTITIGGDVKDQSEFTGDTYTYTPTAP